MRSTCKAILLSMVIIACVDRSHADVPFRAAFTEDEPCVWRTWASDGVELAVVPRQDAQTANDRCLSVAGNLLWVSAVFDLPTPVPLAGPVYVTADVQSLGKSGGAVSLLVANRGKYTHYKTGPSAYRCKDRWCRGIWRLDGFFPDVKDVLIDGLRFAQRVSGEYEVGPDGPGRHELHVDNVAVYTGEDAARIARECGESGGQRWYRGPLAFKLSESSDLVVWHSPSLAKVFQHQPPPERTGDGVSLSLARYEAESFQLVLRSPQARSGLTLRLPALTSDNGAAIPDSAWYWHPVRYVDVTSRYFGVPGGQFWPEPLSWDREITLEPGRTQPVWITLDVPADSAPGLYHGTAELLAGTECVAAIPVSVTVWDVRLPTRPAFRTNQQLWVAAPCPLDPRPRRTVQREMMELLARCRQYNASGFCRLPKEMQTEFMARGQNTIKLPFVGGHRGGAKRQVTKLGGAEVFTPEYEKAFTDHLTRRTQFLREQGWMKYAYLYLWDEPFGDPEVHRIIKWLAQLTKRYDPDIQTSVAAPCTAELLDVIDIFSSGYSSSEAIAAARQRGTQFWCTGVNAFCVDLPAVDQRMAYGFESVRKGYMGAVSWGLAYWGRLNRETEQWESSGPWDEPYRANRNCVVLYPGSTEQSRSEKSVPSIGLELTRDGIEDYGYVALLREQVETLTKDGATTTAQAATALLQRCEQFYVDPKGLRTDFSTVEELLALRAQIAGMLADGK